MSTPWQPHNYQKAAIKFMVSQGAAGLFLDPGLGKTSTTYAAFKVLKTKGLVNRMLVVAPLRPAVSVWPNERSKWDDFSELSVNVLHGSHKAELLAQGADVDVINPEGLGWLFQAVRGQPWPWEMLVIDESTRFKHANTLRFRTLKMHLPRFRRRYILTGTPAPNGLLDLFGQVYILDLGNALGRYITHYRNSYFDSVGYGGYTWIPRADSEERIYGKLRPLVLRMSAEDYLELPPLVMNTVEVTLPESAQKMYDEMEDLLLTKLEDSLITAANTGAATQKCRQIANGGAYSVPMDDESQQRMGAKWVNIHDAKTEAVQELVEELSGKPALVAYEFRHDLERLQAAFPDAPHLGGGVTAKRQREIEAQWNAGLLPVLLVQPQSAAHGLNLQGTHAAIIMHSLTWDLENYEQLIRRVWRQGQRERVVVHHIVAKGTVDEVIMRGVAKKDRTQKALLDALKSHLKSRR